MSTESPPPAAPPKKGFFRRLSLSASAHKAAPAGSGLGVGAGGAGAATPSLRSAVQRPGARAVSTPTRDIGGPAYGPLPRGAGREHGAGSGVNGSGVSTPIAMRNGAGAAHAAPRSPPPQQHQALGVPPVPPMPQLPDLHSMSGPYPNMSPPSSYASAQAQHHAPPTAYRFQPVTRSPSANGRVRNPIVPALAGPPTPPRESAASPPRPVKRSPIKAAALPGAIGKAGVAVGSPMPVDAAAQAMFGQTTGGRVPSQRPGGAQSWAKPALLGQELPPRGSSSAARANGQQPPRHSSPLASSTSTYRFEDAESAPPVRPASLGLQTNGPPLGAAQPPSQMRSSSRRSSSQNRGQKAVVTGPGQAAQGPPSLEIETLEPAAPSFLPAAPPTSSGSLAENARTAFAAAVAFDLQSAVRPTSGERPPSQQSQSAGASPGPREERRLSRPLPRPPASSPLSPSQQAPPPYSASVTASSPVSSHSHTAAIANASPARPPASTSTTSPHTTMHVVAASAKQRDSTLSVGSTGSRGSATEIPSGQPRPRVSISNGQLQPLPPVDGYGDLKAQLMTRMPSTPTPAPAPAPVSRSETPQARPLPINTGVKGMASPASAERRVSQIQRDSPDLSFDFPRSPTLQPLVDPRKSARTPQQSSPLSPTARQSPTVSIDPPRDPVDQWAGDARSSPQQRQPTRKPTLEKLSPVLPSSQLPPRVSSAQGRRIASSPLSSPVLTSPTQTGASHAALQARSPPSGPVYPSAMAAPAPSRSASAAYPSRQAPAGLGTQYRHTSPRHSYALSPQSRRSSLAVPRVKPKRISLLWLLEEPSIATCLLSYLSIDTFLSLLGSDKAMRARFSADIVAKWVFGEWGITYDPELTRSRPGMSTWEGFCEWTRRTHLRAMLTAVESLLHDPAVYSTYPPQYHNLLEHLSLSHTQIVLYLRSLPASAFPYTAQPFDDDLALPPPLSSSVGSLSAHLRLRSRFGSAAGSDTASIATGTGPLGKMPRQERVIEIIMPEPLAPKSSDSPEPVLPEWHASSPAALQKKGRRGSVGSMASTTSFAFGGRKRASSTASVMKLDMPPPITSGAQVAAPMAASGKAALPPVSFPSAKRYGFRRGADADAARARGRASMDSSRPGSIMSVQSSPSMHGGSGHGRASSSYSRYSFAVDHNAPPVPTLPPHLPVPPAIGGGGGGHRASFASSQDTRSKTSSPGLTGRKYESPNQSTRDLTAAGLHNARPEPAFDRPPPFTLGRAPLLRVFVPTSKDVPTWPSAAGAAACLRQLDKVGAVKRLRMGDLVINTAIRQPRNTEHVLVFVPNNRHLLLPLSYEHSATGHLPRIIDGLALPPSFYYPFLPAPQIVYLDLAPYAARAIGSIRLAYDRRDVTVASGARLSAKRYLHVAGLELGPADRCALEWAGLLSLEAEGTQEGKRDLEERLGWGQPARAIMGPWEVVRDKSMMGTVWLRLVKETPRQ
ncbi:hypothetical protein Q5752_002276 [Cryptotrichosporon argae]